MLLFKSISIPLNEQKIIEVLEEEHRGWFGMSVDPDDQKLRILRKHSDGDYWGKSWTLVAKKLEPYIDLTGIDFDPERSLVGRTGPYGFAGPHTDRGRARALIIPLGKNKGQLTFHLPLFKIPMWRHSYTGPTVIRSNIFHSMSNNSDCPRYAIQLHINQA
jgi:hypothetical protein